MESRFTESGPLLGQQDGVSGEREMAHNRITGRLSGPGGYYNIGNVIALVAGATAQILQSPGDQTMREALAAFLFGNMGATWLTISMVIFLVAGEFYHRAYAEPDRPNATFIRLGDLTSGFAALALMAALIQFGDLFMALVAGILLAGGKFGTALLPGPSESQRPIWTQCDWFLRRIVILSRFPSLAALALEVTRVFLTNAPSHTAVMPSIMAFCFLLWLRADILLISAGNTDDGGV